VKKWIVEGKYTTGPGSEWEELDEVSETDTGGPGESKVGRDYAYWLCAEYALATPDARHRVRVKH
jgi:hypothetical protein